MGLKNEWHFPAAYRKSQTCIHTCTKVIIAGMSILKAHYKNKDGKKSRTSKYYVQFRCHLGIIHRIPAYTSKQLSAAFEVKIKEIIEYRKANQPLTPELKQWITGLDNKMLIQFQRIGLIDNSICPDLRRLGNCLTDYLAWLEEHSCSQAHIDNVEARVTSFIAAAKLAYPRQITEQAFLEFRRSLTCGNSTKNHYLVETKAFCNWLVKTKVLPASPIEGIDKLPEDRAEHGILTPEQFLTLITSTERLGLPYAGVPAKERAILYLVAGNTGLRKSELRSLTWGSVQIDKCGIFLGGKYTKNKKNAYLPIIPALAATLKVWKEELDAKDTDTLFPSINSHYRAADAIRTDMTNAGLETVDMYGNTIVFHSLRSSFISFLANQDIPVKIVQQLARHSTPTLTLNVYAKVFSESERTAIKSLPTNKDLH